ncbi:class I SAM-dependent methyltransferase [Streptomyces sp. Agncl-13]|uniref:class I SAM-dependent methyltransferase n=1 Tax=Streptomyces sp. Agncl-13 TaxID=3400628 RepID=UPI003A8948D9
MSFFLEFARNPMTVGAIAPSGPALARIATAAVPRTGSPIVVELGPGTGAFTQTIQERLAGRGRHIAVEVNPQFAQQLAAVCPGADVVNADAADLGTVLARLGFSQIDVVVSGLPWAAFTESRQRDVLSAVVAALPPHGVFTTFAYTHTRWAPPARRLLRSLQSRFDEVVISRTVWANMPPALVYYCRRPNIWASTDAEPTVEVSLR